MVHEYYTFQHRRIAQSPWLKKEPIEKLSKSHKDWDEEWHTCFGGIFNLALNPLHYVKGDCEFVYELGCNEPHDVWEKTRSYGYWNLKPAKAALKRLKEFNAAGKFNYKDGYNVFLQAVRYEFRLVKVIYVPDTIIPIEA